MTSTSDGFLIRPYRDSDEAAFYEVCLKTGKVGDDGSDLFAENPRALGDIYVGPYLRFEPSLAYALEDAQGICGYVLGSLDTALFEKRFVEEWLPPLQAAFPEPKGDPAHLSAMEKLYWQFHHPELNYCEALHPYPSHMHIDLLARAQGHGQGAPMVRLLLGKLRDLGSPGVHLAMSEFNTRADRFYRRLGFNEIGRVGPVGDRVVLLALKL